MISRKHIYQIFIVILALALAASLFLTTNQAIKIDALNDQTKNLKTQINSLHSEYRRNKVALAIFQNASSGMYGLNAEARGYARTIFNHIIEKDRLPESKFLECWNREIRTNRWGSDGPDSEMLLDTCISLVADNQSAILLRESDNAFQFVRGNCSKLAQNRPDAARDCWADANFRLSLGAKEVLFDALTRQDWMVNQEINFLE